MITIENAFKTYHCGKKSKIKAIQGLSLQIDKGEMVAIIGKSGSGKTTLLNAIGCIDQFDSGSYFLDGLDISTKSDWKLASIRNVKIGYVFQNFALVETDTVLENIMLPFYFNKKISMHEATERSIEAVELIGLAQYKNQSVNELSGGQKQRVAIARAIVNQPSVILADEPTGALDSKTAAEIMSVFKELHQQNKTVIIVTHDMGVAEQCARIIEIADGKIITDKK